MTPTVPAAPEFGQPLPQAPSQAVIDFLANRRSSSAVTLAAPGPDKEQLADMLRLAARTPDHGKLAPWRFVILRDAAKVSFAEGLEAIARDRPDAGKLAAKLVKLKAPPLAVAVIFSPRPGDIPIWEQTLSAGAVCILLLQAASAMGFGGNWITDWYAYDPQARSLLGLGPDEQLAGYVLLGTATEPPSERIRPDVEALTLVWTPAG
ncbi:MAG: nitroreductase [Caulobacter sp.]|nr:nitroreductase [Caulobacter sp.]